MPKYVIKQGECLSSLAAARGVPSWKDLHDHPDNADLKKKRPNPNVLAPGDVVIVPETKKFTCATGKKHTFVVRMPKVKLRLLLQNWKGEPYGDRRFEVTIAGNQIPGRTDGAGLIDIAIPVTAQRGRLKVWFDEDQDDPDPNIDRDLEIGHLDPVDNVTGVQARLQNLGHRCEVSGNLDEGTLASARAFREKVGLPAVADDALIDDTLCSELLKLHDGE
ncbi:MAG: hypothetical protein WB755_29200 [Terriglobales bacterium]